MQIESETSTTDGVHVVDSIEWLYYRGLAVLRAAHCICARFNTNLNYVFVVTVEVDRSD